MKRSPSLARLSREHHSALVLAKRAQRLDTAATEATKCFMAEVLEIFARELEPHFQTEEDALLPPLKSAGQIALARRALSDHEALRALASRLGAGETASLHRFGDRLEAHVRFEERELFPVAEAVLTSEALALIEESSHHPTTHPQGA